MIRFLNYLFTIGLLFATSPVFSQHDTSTVNDIYGKKWWLNAITIEYFGENDTTSVTTTISDNEYMMFSLIWWISSASEEYMSLHPNEKDKSWYRYYLREDNLKSASLELYRTKKDEKKNRVSEYYDLFINDFELKLVCYPRDELHRGIGEMRTYIYNTIKDTNYLQGRILGTWAITDPENQNFDRNRDTMILQKINPKDLRSEGPFYEFKWMDGYLYCKYDKPFDLPESNSTNQKRGCIPDPYYIYNSSQIYLDVVHKQLHFDNSDSVYEILKLDEHQMILKLHQE